MLGIKHFCCKRVYLFTVVFFVGKYKIDVATTIIHLFSVFRRICPIRTTSLKGSNVFINRIKLFLKLKPLKNVRLAR